MYAVVLAGGSGTRLWPLSRASKPKHLLSLLSGRSLLQETVDRVLKLVTPDRVVVVTEASHASDTMAQLPDLPVLNFIVEPVRRGTAAALALAAAVIEQRDPTEVMASLHSDAFIKDQEAFSRAMKVAAQAAESGPYLVTIGIKPSYPATHLGYIQVGEPWGAGDFEPLVYRAARFVEKPAREEAESYLAEGSHLWNSGIFVWRVETILQQFREHMPNLYRHARQAVTDVADGSLKTRYQDLEVQTIDYGIMEKARDVLVVAADMGWSDVGSWADVHQLLPRDGQGNVVHGQHLGIDSADSLVWVSTRPVITVGLRDMVVVETPDALLVCHKDRSQEVKRAVEAMAELESLRHLC